MNTTDLRDELTALAEPVTAPPTLADGVASKITATRRRRTGLTAAGAGLAVAAIAVGVLTTTGHPAPPVPAAGPSSAAPMIGSDGMPFRSVPDAPGDVLKNGLRYRVHVADDTLTAGFIGDRGQGQFSLVWTPTTTQVSLGAECYLPGLTDAKARTYMVSVGLEGTQGVFGTQCSAHRPTERDLPGGGGIPGEPGQGWTELTVGKTARLRVQLVDAKTMKPAAVDGVQLTGAVYELGDRQSVVDASGRTVASLPDVVEQQGYRYRFLAMKAAPADATTLPRMDTPVGAPFLVTAGTAGSDPSKDPGTMYITGLGSQTGSSGGGWQTIPQPARGAGSVGLRSEGPAQAGTAFIALYTLER